MSLLKKEKKETPQASINRTDLLLILFVTIAWGLNYPVMKFAVKSYPPITFRTLSFIIGIATIGFLIWKDGQTFKVPVNERYKVWKLSLGSMVCWHFGLIFGVLLLQSGRAAIIGYTMPVWALLSGVIFYGAKFTWRGSVGVVFALSATMLLAATESATILGAPLGLIVMLAAAACWGMGTVMMKHIHVSITNLLMTFWTLVIALGFFIIAAIIFERDQWRMPSLTEWLAIFYGGLIGFAFCYVAWFRVARKLPPVVSGLSIMLVPVVGVFSSALLLGEKIGGYDYLALIFILAAMLAVLVPTSAKTESKNT